MTSGAAQVVSGAQVEVRSRRAPIGSALCLEGVTRRYADKVVLDAISLALPSNEYVSLLGPSGSGKTVLLRLIAGFEVPDAGRIILGGKRIDEVAAHRRGIGFVFQNFALFPHLNVFDNIAFGLAHGEGTATIDGQARRARVADMIALVGLNGLERRGVHEISGGQRQRVALARTMVTQPRLVLLDEPLGALDANLRARMREELRNLRDRLGVTFLHVTGSEAEALAMGDHVIVLDRGRVSQFDAPDAIYSRPATPEVARSLNCYNLFTGQVGADGFSCAHALFAMARVDVKCAQPTYAIRHDLIRFAPPEETSSPDQTGLLAKFVTSEYSGSTIRYFFEVGTGQIVEVEDHLSHRRPADLEPGRAYRLTWAVGDAVVFG